MKTNVILKNALIGDTITDLVVKEGKIAYIGKVEEDGYDCQGFRLRPGLIDIHTHGCGGFDTMDSPIEELSLWHKAHGVTSFLPTTMTAPIDALIWVCQVIPACEGAHVLGYHLEGPYLAEAAKGAQNAAFLATPNLADFSCIPNVKMVTIAPELPGAMDFISGMEGAVVCLGHTVADYDTCMKAFEKGANCLTHTCNAMPLLHHRSPGPIGAALDAGAYAQVICDGIHIHPSMIRILYRLFGKEKMVLISDSMSATGLPDGDYSLGGQKVYVRDGVARIDGGAFAGSTTCLLDCVKRAIAFGIPEEDAFAMASETPATLLGVKKGKLEVGYDAEFILLDTQNNLQETLIFS
jgi:N-acetylglucosamine-6-phosphate deacetylase